MFSDEGTEEEKTFVASQTLTVSTNQTIGINKNENEVKENANRFLAFSFELIR